MIFFPDINYYTFSLLLGGVIALVSGVSVYLRGEKGVQNLAWLALNICTAVWSFGYLSMVISTSSKIALLSNWVLHFGAIFIPFFYFLFIISIAEIYQKYRKYLYLAGFLAIIFSLFNTTTFFVKGVLPKFTFNYAPEAGPMYIFFTFYFFLLVGYSLFILLEKIRKTRGEETLRLKYILWSSVAGFAGGGSVFFLTFNIGIPPYLLIMFSLYPLIISYAILKYNLFSIRLILVELAVLLLNLFLFLNIFTSHTKTELTLNVSVSLFVLLFSSVLIRNIYKDIKDRERIEALVKEMEVANERLRLMEGQKTEFVSIASHQLRTPLTVIKGYASMILEETFGAITAPARDAMEKLYKSSERIVALVEDLLTVSRIEQGRMILNFETVNFKDFVQGVLEEVKTEAQEAQIDLSFLEEDTAEPLVSIDKKKFKQVVRHIVENAIKYTPAPGSVRVAIAHDNIANKIRLIVSDTGSGMTHEQITAIFERFNLKVNASEKEEDHGEHLVVPKEEADVTESEMMEKRTPGIGLYIAQEIIEAHHGTIHIKSAGQGKGTTVVVELPRAEEV